ncbi:response regulator transcription factor [Bacillus salitolerans]|uniref:Response regulator transcription factor n=1 Tax=Bacillus salitolerans TaxID=1437434 RepID=A0ABW4LUT9_9BACI
MERSIRFLQNLQDDYAQLASLSLLMIDLEGHEITTLSNETPLVTLIYKEFVTKEVILSFINPLNAIKQPVMMDTELGLKVIISPIWIRDQLSYFIIAGFLLERTSQDLVIRSIEQKRLNRKYIAEMIEAMGEHNDEEKKKCIDVINKFTFLVEDYLTLQQDKSKTEQQLDFTKESLGAIRIGNATPFSFFDKLNREKSQIEFYGLAIENKHKQYEVTYTTNKIDCLKGQTFLMGEGFLGHIIASKQFQFWKNTQLDPRASIFKRQDINVISLFGAPVYIGDTVKGVFFGGSTKTELDEDLSNTQGIMKAALISNKLTVQQVRASLQNHLLELSTFNEVFKAITSVEDIKRVLYILVDISINVMRGPFSCIVYKGNANQSKVDIVSRGLSETEINKYGYEVAVKNFSHPVTKAKTKQVTIGRTSWGRDVLEFPLLFQDHLYGVLCVGLNSKDDAEKFQSFLSSLSVAGGISLHLNSTRNNIIDEESIALMLNNIVKNLDPQKYEKLSKISDLVESFAQFLQLDHIELLKQACLATVYDSSLLKQFMKNNKLLEVVEDFKSENKESMRVESEILTLVTHFVEGNEQIDSLKKLVSIEENLKSKFILYLQQQPRIELELSMNQIDLMEKTTIEMDNEALKQSLNLSTREKEVLNLVLKGHSNHEIAHTLYISEHTVKNHMTKILQKLGVADRAQAIAKVYQMGYVPQT